LSRLVTEADRVKKEPFVNIQDVATLLDVSTRTVLRLIAAGKFPGAFKVSDQNSPWRIPATEIETYIKKQRDQARKA